MTEDFPVRFLDTRDDSQYLDTGKVERTRKYTFKLGDRGPFVERVPLDPFDEQEIVRRIQTVRNHLRLIAQA